VKIAKWQSKNGYGEISAYGSIVDETLVEVWITSNGSGARVVTAAEAIARVLVEADDAGYVLNCQLHTHPGLSPFWSIEDQQQQVALLDLVGHHNEFTFMCVDGFSWIARTCIGYTCIDRPVMLDDVELQGENSYVYGNWGYYDPLAPGSYSTGAYPAFEDSADWCWEYRFNDGLDAPAYGSQVPDSVRPGCSQHRKRRSERLWAERSYADEAGRFTRFSPYNDRYFDHDEK
jgi:hypothetical protein